MHGRHVKQGQANPGEADALAATVGAMLAELEAEREPAAQRLARELDGFSGEIVVSDEAIAAACARVPQSLKDDIAYAHENISRFAQAQRDSIRETEIELRPGLIAGQRLIPVQAAGCYIPGGRYSHIASAMMTVTTARIAGVPHIAAVSPPRSDAVSGIPDAILYTLHHCGADRILALGGIQGIAAMAFGLFGLPRADILVGPGNQYVAEAKRLLFGRIGIDMVAGPTDSLIIADAGADALTVAWDLIGQAEHGANSPVWLVTDCPALAAEVARLAPLCAAELPQPNRSAAEAAWSKLGEIILCPSREAMAAEADRIAPEHLHVQAADLDWWKSRLTSYGSLFLGAETTVAFGDKAAGTNHVLPTSGAARYTGGLSVHKFLKTVTWQRVTPEALPRLAAVTANISRFEGMEGHARTADIRLAKHLVLPT
ncbi:histidinol dehydrogenase [Pseudotabrizicola algicola]|uniref:Histidinol dehydrogenase homolog n=1 Tax=Pseudotabrizicola algicola TaxID=2709381 RepID=A0A6B3RML7_9RHOB|nr:histidinol dehydrogenase [Pseudotabrizicola algicola]NEX46423.1 histidinol dehydrogenase [Pseudotabrizicola algicola]